MVSRWLSVCPSICSSVVGPSVFLFLDNNLNECLWISPSLVCALLLLTSGLGLLMGKFCQFLTELSTCNMSGFSFPDDNLSKYKWIFSKLGVCINEEIWFGIHAISFRLKSVRYGKILREIRQNSVRLSYTSLLSSPYFV